MRTIRMLLLSLLAGVPAGAEEFLRGEKEAEG